MVKVTKRHRNKTKNGLQKIARPARTQSMISYAQQFEDVILWRALKHVKAGAYVDIGANDPILDSVSLHFYLHGWRGVHVEPMPEYAQRLRESRPDELVLEAAIGADEGEITLFSIEGTGLTTAVQSHAERHVEAGYKSKKIKVPVVPLSKVFEEFNRRDIHWLKIDVEGMEQDVLSSWGDHPARPWIVLIESTLPNLPEENYEEWEDLLLSRGYEFVYFDGLNRFYVHEDQIQLKDAFGPGPNFFDDFILSDKSFFASEVRNKWYEANAEADATKAALNKTQEKLQQQTDSFSSAISAAVDAVKSEAQETRARLDAQLSAAMDNKAELEANIADLSAQLSDRNAEVDRLSGTLAEQATAFESARAEAEQAFADKIGAVQKDLLDALTRIEGLTESHARDRDELIERFEAEIRDRTESHARQVQSLTADQAAQLRNMADSHAQDRYELTAEFEGKIRDLVEARERTILELTAEYEGWALALARSHEAKLAEVEEAREEQVAETERRQQALIGHYEARLSQRDAEFATLIERRTTELDAQIEELRHQAAAQLNDALDAHAAELAESRRAHQADASISESLIAARDAEIGQLKLDLDHARTEAEARERHHRAKAFRAEMQASSLMLEVGLLKQDVDAQKASIAAIRRSTSWKMSAPVRWIGFLLRAMKSGIKHLLRTPLEWALAIVRRNTWMKGPILWAANLVPPVRRKIDHFSSVRQQGVSARAVEPQAEFIPAPAKPALQTVHVPAIDAAPAPVESATPRKRVALVAPTSTSGTMGGAERLYNGLLDDLIRQGFDAELVTLPFDESSFQTIQAGYKAFEELDLSGFDLVISTKAPTYCVKHPNHVLYLVHTIRVFYDMFDVVFPDADEHRHAERAWIHAKDTMAISAIPRRYAIGVEVAERLKSFNGLSAGVLHPAIDLSNCQPSPIGDFFFLPGRLHAWKRVDLAIRAVLKSSLPMRLVITGTGEDEERLKTLAKGDGRIEFHGFVSDEKLAQLYRDARAVVFPPVREDYGYVTIEAFAHAKPVITCRDSGEPTQFVRNSETGYVCAPDPESIRSAMEYLWQNPAVAEDLGQRGLSLSQQITWNRVTSVLTDEDSNAPAATASGALSKRVAVLDMQPISPAVGGGRLRLLGLYHNLGKDFDTRYVGTYDWPGEKFRRHKLSDTLEEITVPLSAAHHKAAEESRQKADGRVVIDMLFSEQGHLSADYIREMNEAVEWADVVIFSHPWVAPLVDDSKLAGKLVVYDSHNIEIDLREQILNRDAPFQKHVLDEVERAERSAGDRAHIILACSQSDADRFEEHYKWPSSHIEIVPNGVFADAIRPAAPAAKAAARSRFGLRPNETAAFFIGSDYAPNIEAAWVIVRQIAPVAANVRFVIAGGVCDALTGPMPDNVTLAGRVSDEDRLAWLQCCDIAVNPMMSGSGTNIKMFDFAAAGLPIVTTPVGARGIVEDSAFGIDVCSVPDMADRIAALATDQQARDAAGAANRDLVEKCFAWETLSPDFGRIITTELLRLKGMQASSNFIRDRKKVIHFTTLGQRCGIGEYSRHLTETLDAMGVQSDIFSCQSPDSPPDLTGYEDRSQIAWFYDNILWRDSRLMPGIERMIADSGASAAIIHHHPGFLPGEWLLQLLRHLRHHGVHPSIILHANTEEQQALLKQVAELGVPIISHKKEDILTAARHGFSMIHTPLAVGGLEPAPERNSIQDAHAPIIVTNGFLRQHKGIPSLVKAFASIKDTTPNARLRILCPSYPSEDSSEALREVEDTIRHFNLNGAVELDTAFHEKEHLLAELKKADLGVLAYAESSEGGSAAATDALAAGLPLIVTNARIFDDIRMVSLTSTPDEESLSHCIQNLLQNRIAYARLARRAKGYADRHSWKKVAESILATLI